MVKLRDLMGICLLRQFGFPYAMNWAKVAYFKMFWASWRGRKLGKKNLFGDILPHAYTIKVTNKIWGSQWHFLQVIFVKIVYIYTFIQSLTHSTNIFLGMNLLISLYFTGPYSFFRFQLRNRFILGKKNLWSIVVPKGHGTTKSSS